MALGAALGAPAAGADDPAGHLVAAINQARAGEGLGPLTADARLSRAALGHARDMAAKGFVSHRGSDRAEFSARVERAGYRWSFVAENIAAGESSARAVARSWMASAGHRRNMLSAEARQIGVGHAFVDNDRGPMSYRHYWVAVFARAKYR